MGNCTSNKDASDPKDNSRAILLNISKTTSKECSSPFMQDLLEQLKQDNAHLFEDTQGTEDIEIKEKSTLHKWHKNENGNME